MKKRKKNVLSVRLVNPDGTTVPAQAQVTGPLRIVINFVPATCTVIGVQIEGFDSYYNGEQIEPVTIRVGDGCPVTVHKGDRLRLSWKKASPGLTRILSPKCDCDCHVR